MENEALTCTAQHSTHTHTHTHRHTDGSSMMMSGPKSHHLGEKTGQNLITASWNEITTPALLLYRSQYIIHPSLPPSPTNCIKPQICPLEPRPDCSVGWWNERRREKERREREERDASVGDFTERRASFCVTQSKLSQGHIETCKLEISHTGVRIWCVSASVCTSHKVGCTVTALYHTQIHKGRTLSLHSRRLLLHYTIWPKVSGQPLRYV